jgi:exopolysaccharide biosynthesis protein
MKVNGINTNFFETSMPSNINTIYGVAVNNGNVISPINVKGPRATLIYTTDGKLEIKYITDIRKEYDVSKIRWAVGGGGLLQNGKDVYNPKNENFRDDVTRKCNHSGIGFANGKVFLFVKEHTWYDPCPLSRLVKTAQNLELTDAIFFDGGGSSQINYKGQGLKSTRKISTAILLKEE